MNSYRVYDYGLRASTAIFCRKDTLEEAARDFLPDGADDMDTYVVVVEAYSGVKYYFLCVYREHEDSGDEEALYAEYGTDAHWEIEGISGEHAQAIA